MRNPYLGAKKIYHYTSAEGLLGILNGEWWATEAHYLNDPTELSLGLDGFVSYVNQSELPESKRDCIINLVCKEYSSLYQSHQNREMFIISFSYQKDSPLMWSEFPGYSGYCLGFDKQAIISSFNCGQYELVALGDVRYIGDKFEEESSAVYFWALNHAFDVSDAKSALNLLAEREEGKIQLDCREIAADLMTSGAFIKNKSFSGEFEFRLIFTQKWRRGDMQSGTDDVSFRVRGNVIIPFARISCDIANCLIDVTVGPVGDYVFARRGLQRLLDYRGIRVPVEQSSIPLRF